MQKPKNVLTSRTATQQGFVNLVKELCDICEIKCEIVEGFYKFFSEAPTKFKL